MAFLDAPYVWAAHYSRYEYRQTSNINRTLVDNKIVDHSDACRRCSNYILVLGLTPGFNGLGNDNCTQDEKQVNLGIWCALYQGFDSVRYVAPYILLTICISQQTHAISML